MFGWRTSAGLPIGIEIGSHNVRMLQLKQQREGLEIQAAACADIPPTEPDDAPGRSAAIVATLKKLLAGGQFVGRRCVTCLTPALLHARSVRLPPMPENELAQAVQWEARDRLGFDPADGQLVFFPAGEVRRGSETKQEILVFAATGEILRRHIDEITAASLDMHAIDLQPTAILRALRRVTPALPGQLSAALDLGYGGAQLVLAQDDHLVFYKHIDVGSQALDQAIAAKLGVSPSEAVQIRNDLSRAAGTGDAPSSSSGSHLEQAVTDAMRPVLEELGRELDMCIRYFVVTFRGTRPDTIHLAGGQSQCGRIIDFLASSLSLRIEAVQPLRGLPDAAAHVQPNAAGEWTVAAGLALYCLAEQRAEAAA